MQTNPRLHLRLLVILLVFVFTNSMAQEQQAPLKIGPQPDGSVLVPSNQFLRPAGFQIYLPGRPVDISLLSNGEFLLVKNIKSLDLIRLSDKTLLQSLPYGKGGSSFTGICTSKDNRKIYLTEATNKVLIAGWDPNNHLTWGAPIQLPSPSIGGDPAPGGLVLNSREDKLFVTLSRNNSLAVITMADNAIREIPVGMAPYTAILHSDSKAYVSNWGGRRPTP